MHAAPVELLLVDDVAAAAAYGDALRQHYPSVNITASRQSALQYLRKSNPTLVVANLTLSDGSALDICRAATEKPAPPSLLITADRPEDVPDVLAAGCNGILLKPFSPSLLVNRVSRMLRDRSQHLRLQAARSRSMAAHLLERTEFLKVGSNRVWPSHQCPYCAHAGVTSFDYASSRRAWYACLECRKVWLAKRLDS
jgi:DNA-binding response OmpR family regulator